MKTIGNQKSGTGNLRAFTLIELLVVIAIIGILAAMLMPVLSKVKENAQKMKAKTEITELVNAIQSYDADNSRFPANKGERDYAMNFPQNGQNDLTVGMFGTPVSQFNNNQVVAILMDMEKFPSGVVTSNSSHIYNPKQVKYLNAKLSGYDPATNDPKPPGGVDNSGIYRDPWGNPYIITMDLSYDEQASDLLYARQVVSQDGTGAAGHNGLSNPELATKPDNFLFRGKVMVWSAGPDKTYSSTDKATAGKNKDNILSW